MPFSTPQLGVILLMIVGYDAFKNRKKAAA